MNLTVLIQWLRRWVNNRLFTSVLCSPLGYFSFTFTAESGLNNREARRGLMACRRINWRDKIPKFLILLWKSFKNLLKFTEFWRTWEDPNELVSCSAYSWEVVIRWIGLDLGISLFFFLKKIWSDRINLYIIFFSDL
jgi:hypothetical protein